MTEENKNPNEKEFIADFLEALGKGVGTFEEKLNKHFEDLRNDQGLKENVEKVKEGAKERAEKISDTAKGTYEKLPDGFTDNVEKVADKTADVLGKAFEATTEFFHTLKSDLEQEFERNHADRDSEEFNESMPGSWGSSFGVCAQGCCTDDCNKCTNECKNGEFPDSEENSELSEDEKTEVEGIIAEALGVPSEYVTVQSEDMCVENVTNGDLSVHEINKKLIELYEEIEGMPEGTFYYSNVRAEIEQLRELKRNLM